MDKGKHPGVVLDEQLKQTELGEFILKYKMPFIVLVVAVFLSLVGYGVYGYFTEQRNGKISEKIYQFENKEYKDFVDKKISLEEFIGKFKALLDESSGFSGVVSLNIEVSDTLVKQGNLKEAKDVLERGRNLFASSNPFIGHFYYSRLANVYEDLAEYPRAVEVLEKMLEEKIKLLEWKTYLDIGRMYLKIGNKEKAKASFKYVIENFNEEEYSKVARLYLQKVGQK